MVNQPTITTNNQTNNVSANFNRASDYRRNVGSGSTLVCEHCGFNGHTKEKCFKLIGFPPNFGKKGNNFRPQNNKKFSNNNYNAPDSSATSEVGPEVAPKIATEVAPEAVAKATTAVVTVTKIEETVNAYYSPGLMGLAYGGTHSVVFVGVLWANKRVNGLWFAPSEWKECRT
ncbi:reverse transcriptase, RNA-dependent DNA polymerase, Gag-polypeptide of LTR copia-type [Artemisia annua]|uniref:Reverse transcriptase, RNA-dependent DNA polymerase, Gag-polypeptide of LTR copia-type n=1 Tax=Artemisia annua TaxID=35608 RepID=A0A2U1PCQ7_ARTAN|nr:reverse transcriptase, RNA-dependent DNA polymerase, Gag-polypeptide of LTR copia-type [Artemisia annua]